MTGRTRLLIQAREEHHNEHELQDQNHTTSVTRSTQRAALRACRPRQVSRVTGSKYQDQHYEDEHEEHHDEIYTKTSMTRMGSKTSPGRDEPQDEHDEMNTT